MGNLTKKKLFKLLVDYDIPGEKVRVLGNRIWEDLPALMTEKGVQKLQLVRKKLKDYRNNKSRAHKDNKRIRELELLVDQQAKFLAEEKQQVQVWMGKYAMLKDRGADVGTSESELTKIRIALSGAVEKANKLARQVDYWKAAVKRMSAGNYYYLMEKEP